MIRKLDDRLPGILFLCIVLSFAPIFYAASFKRGVVSGSWYSISVGAAFLLELAILTYYFFRVNGFKLEKKLLVFPAVFMLSQTATIIASLLSGLEVNYLDAVNIFARFSTTLLLLVIPARFVISEKGLERFMKAILAFGVVASVNNIIINFKNMIAIFGNANPYSYNFTSFYLNRNHFAEFLVFALISNVFLLGRKKTPLRWVSLGLILVNMAATLSRTTFATAGIFVMVCAGVYLKKNIKDFSRERLLRKKVVIPVGILIAGVAAVFVFSPDTRDFILYKIIRLNAGTSGRSELWAVGIGALSVVGWILGVGYFTGTDFITKSGYDLTEFHNFYIEALVGGGIVEIILLIGVFAFVFKSIMRIYRNDRLAGTVYFASYAAFGFFAMFESISFFSVGYVGTLFTVFLITVPVLYSNRFRRQSRGLEEN